jgi:hypothetical protein
MLRYAAKIYSIGKRIQGEDERESNYYQQKEAASRSDRTARPNHHRAANILCLGHTFSNITK